MASRTHRTRQTSTSEEALEIIRRLCSERALLLEEVKQLSAAVMVYKELARRAELGLTGGSARPTISR